MAELTQEDIQYLGRLAKIQLSASDVKRMQTELTSVLAYVKKLQAVDTKNIEPTSQVTGLTDVWRKDVAAEAKLAREDLLKNAPQVRDGYIEVKRVIQ